MENGSRTIMERKLVLLLVAVVLLLPNYFVSAQPAEKGATLVIVDSRDPAPWDYKIRFYDETGAEVATMKKCGLIHLNLTPGPHKFWSNKGKKQSITINAVAGETYYAAGGIKNPTLPQSMRFDFELVTREEAESWVMKCNLPTSSLEGKTSKTEAQP
jgi:hypothetical protein